MPEGDTIHELAGILRGELTDTRIHELRIEHQPAESFQGAVIDEVFAVGKHLFLASGQRAVRTHLGMYGEWHRYRRGERWREARWSASVVLRADVGDYVCFRAREAELVDLAGHRHRAFLRRLGPDLLGPEFDAPEAVSRARRLLGPAAPLADVLLDQRVAAGIGNVYKSELLFLAGLSPEAPLGRAEDASLARLFDDARAALRRNLGPGARRLRGPRPAAAGQGSDDDPRLWVYGRADEPCLLCGAHVRYARLGRHRRGTWWCPSCQAAPSPRPSGHRQGSR